MEPESLVQHASRTVLKIDALRPVDDHSRCKGQDRLQSDGQPEGRLSAPEDANKAANKGVQFFLLPFFFSLSSGSEGGDSKLGCSRCSLFRIVFRGFRGNFGSLHICCFLVLPQTFSSSCLK